MSNSSLNYFSVQEIEFRPKKMILDIEKLKKKEESFLKKRKKRFGKKEIEVQLERAGLGIEKWILLIKKLEEDEGGRMVKSGIKIFNEYLDVKNERIDLFISLENLRIKIDKGRKKMGGKGAYKFYSKLEKLHNELYEFRKACVGKSIGESLSGSVKIREEIQKLYGEWHGSSAELQKSYAKNLSGVVKTREIEKRKGEIEDSLNRNKKELNKILGVLEKFFIKTNLKERLNNQKKIIFCFYCGAEIRQGRFCPDCGLEI